MEDIRTKEEIKSQMKMLGRKPEKKVLEETKSKPSYDSNKLQEDYKQNAKEKTN